MGEGSKEKSKYEGGLEFNVPPALKAKVLKLPRFQRSFIEDCLDLYDLASASSLLKVGMNKVFKLALRFKESRLKVGLSDVACTKEARVLLREVLAEASKYAVMEPSKYSILLTMPSLNRSEVEARLKAIEEASNLLKEVDYEGLREELSQASFKPLKMPSLKIALATTTRKLQAEVEEYFSPFIKAEFIDSMDKAREVLEENDLTLTMTQLSVEEPGLIQIAGLEDVEVVPHLISSLYSSWTKPLETSIKLARTYPDFVAFKKVGKMELEPALELLKLMSQQPPSLKEEAFEWLESEARSRARRVVKEGLGLEAFKGEVRSLLDEASLRFKLSSRALRLLEEALEEVEPPYFELPKDELEVLKRSMVKEEVEKYFLEARELVKKFLEVKEEVKLLLKSLIEFDVALALARFSLDYGLKPPKIIERLGMGFINARNLFLIREERLGRLRVQEVSYTLGETDIKLFGAKPVRTVLLTGANSGGKTTLLQTLAQIHLMSLSGLPIPAERAEVPTALIFFFRRKTAKRLGSLEYAIRRLRSIFTKPGPKLILIDEFEALTEPGAMGRMMASFLNGLPRRSLTVFVTHLSREILPYLRVSFRVDGIEARGVDERGELIVDRQPVFNHVGVSSPELIIDKLLKEARKVRVKKLYEDMLTSLKGYAAEAVMP